MKDKALILIVDDEAANIQVLAACLNDDYRIKVAISGEQCLALLQEDEIPDLILLDIEMPGMNGYEVCGQIKNNELIADVPVIFVTAKDNESDEEKGFNLGAVDYITKPVTPSIVKARVKTHVTLKQQRDLLESMAMHDQLTGLYNRRYLFDVSAHKITGALRHAKNLSLLMMDIDYFKNINDTHGHAAGDEILKAVSGVLGEHNRKEDLVARFGGEEFVIILEYCSLEDAKLKAEEIREKVESLKPLGIAISISIGVAQLLDKSEDFDGLLKRADDALYIAKDNGRNCVVLSKGDDFV